MSEQENTYTVLSSHNLTVNPTPYNGATYQQPQFVPTITFPTPESLRAFVEQRVSAYLDEKLDERVGKALDELAREFNENKAFKPNPFYVETPGSEHAV